MPNVNANPAESCRDISLLAKVFRLTDRYRPTLLSLKLLPRLKKKTRPHGMQYPISRDKDEDKTSHILIVSQYPAKITEQDWKCEGG